MNANLFIPLPMSTYRRSRFNNSAVYGDVDAQWIQVGFRFGVMHRMSLPAVASFRLFHSCSNTTTVPLLLGRHSWITSRYASLLAQLSRWHAKYLWLWTCLPVSVSVSVSVSPPDVKMSKTAGAGWIRKIQEPLVLLSRIRLRFTVALLLRGSSLCAPIRHLQATQVAQHHGTCMSCALFILNIDGHIMGLDENSYIHPCDVCA